MTAYLTIAGPGTAQVEAKRSRFLAVVERVASEDAARAVLERARREHWDARHHCSAWVVGPPPNPLERSSDDGEPAGTAGAPMLDALHGRGVCDVVAVVTRWFGGTLLGAGGLVRAYGDAVRAALDDAGTLRRALVREHLLELGHADAGRVEGALRSRGVTVLDVEHGERVRLRLGVPPGDEAAVSALVAELTAGGSARVAGERWVDGPAG